MTETTTPSAPARSAGVRRITLDADGTTLSGLLSEPAQLPPRAVVVALHGGGVTSGYFDGQAHPDVSLLTLGAALGFTVLALDRPGYGASAGRHPGGLPLDGQAAAVRAGLTEFAARHATGAGYFLLGHSWGGLLTLTLAADAELAASCVGLEVSGCGRRLAPEPEGDDQDRDLLLMLRNWGPRELYPPGTMFTAQADLAPMPVRELAAVIAWTRRCDDVLARIRIPARVTFAEHEAWWAQSDDDLAALASRLGAAPRVVVDRQPDAGHNVSLGRTARAYHLKVLGFLEECLNERGAGKP